MCIDFLVNQCRIPQTLHVSNVKCCASDKQIGCLLNETNPFRKKHAKIRVAFSVIFVQEKRVLKKYMFLKDRTS